MVTRHDALNGMLAVGALIAGAFSQLRPTRAWADPQPFTHRGAWVDRSTMQSFELIDKAIDNARELGLNALYPQVWSATETSHPSEAVRRHARLCAVSPGDDVRFNT